jgi:hypothetical protein
MENEKKNDWYPVGIWLQANDLKMAWLSRRLEVSPMTISIWKKNGKIPHSQKLGICYVTGETYDSMFGGVE